MNKIKIKILESATSKGCKHDHLICGSCGSIIMMREPRKFNVKRFMALAKRIEESDNFFTDSWVESYDKLGGNTLEEGLRARKMQQFLKENPLVIDDEIEERFESWLAERR